MVLILAAEYAPKKPKIIFIQKDYEYENKIIYLEKFKEYRVKKHA